MLAHKKHKHRQPLLLLFKWFGMADGIQQVTSPVAVRLADIVKLVIELHPMLTTTGCAQ